MNDDVQLPRADDAERYCIGCLVKFPQDAGELFDLLTATDFFDTEHQKIFAAAQRQFAAGGIDPVLLGRAVGDTRTLVDLGINPHNAPSTVAHISTEAAKIVEAWRKRQWYDHHQTMAINALDGWTSEQLYRVNESALYESKREREAKQQSHKFAFADLHSRYPDLKPILIDGLARYGEVINIIANPKVGKSWFAYYLALCIITGRPLFGRFATTPSRVLIIDNELHPETLSHRIPVVASAMGIDRSEYGHELDVWTLRGNLRSLNDVADDLEAIDPQTYGLILFDAKYRFATAGQSENDNAAEAIFYNRADQIAKTTGAAIAFIHHASKGSQSDKRASDVGSGAGAQSRAADVHAIFREHEDDDAFVFEALVRSFAPVEPIGLRWIFPMWVPDSDVDPAMLKGRLKPKQQQQNAADQESGAKILTALVDGPATSTELGPKTGISRERRNRLLDWLCSRGNIVFEEITKRGNNCRVYRLTEQSE